MRATDAAAVQSFYARIARVFDVVARRFPGVAAQRARAAALLSLADGDTVVDVGCGTGANAPHLRRHVGGAGRIVGIDVTEALLRRARERGVDVVRGDGADPPLAGPVDGVAASFVIGMFDDPAAVVERWAGLLGGDGRLVLLEATTSDHPVGRLANPAFRLFVRAGAPGRSEGAAAALDRRVAAAVDALRAAEGVEVTTERRLYGFVALVTARVRG